MTKEQKKRMIKHYKERLFFLEEIITHNNENGISPNHPLQKQYEALKKLLKEIKNKETTD